MKFLLVLALVLTGCQQNKDTIDSREDSATKTITWTTTEDIEAPRHCGPDFLQSYGCYKKTPTGCEVITSRPRSTDDRDRLESLGTEVYKCFLNSKEY